MSDYVNFGDFCRKHMGIQCQYGSRYFDKIWTTHPDPYVFLGEGLRFKGSSADYHAMQIHKDDCDEAARRYDELQKRLLTGK